MAKRKAENENGESNHMNTETSSTSPLKRKKSLVVNSHGEEMPVCFEDISCAAYRIKNHVKKTKCKHSDPLSDLTKMNIYLKNDYKQHTGSFKERGACNTLMLLSEEQKKHGVIAASAGNHALALAYHGKLLGIKVTVVMPEIAPFTKIDRCKKQGAEVIIKGAHLLESKEHAMKLAAEKNYLYINGYDHPDIIAGAGTMGLEILEQVSDADAIIVPIGGGGLIAGVALAVKTLKPSILIIGVEPVRCPSYTAALKEGKPVKCDTSSTLADGLAVSQVGDNAFKVSRDMVDKVVLVHDKFIALAVLRLLELERRVVEGAGAAGLAAILEGLVPELAGKKVVVPLCGGNIDTTILGRIVERGLAADSRLIHFKVTVDDKPGGLHGLTNLLHREKASIKDISHERAWLEEDVFKVQNTCVVETLGLEHSDKIHKALLDANYPVLWKPVELHK